MMKNLIASVWRKTLGKSKEKVETGQKVPQSKEIIEIPKRTREMEENKEEQTISVASLQVDTGYTTWSR
jgi:hypothetical protein